MNSMDQLNDRTIEQLILDSQALLEIEKIISNRNTLLQKGGADETMNRYFQTSFQDSSMKVSSAQSIIDSCDVEVKE